VLPDSPAFAAGLARGDVITGVNGTPIFTSLDFRNVIEGVTDGEEITVQVTRGGTHPEVKARLQAQLATEETPEGQNRLGVTVEPGVVVAEVLPGSSAATAGLAQGDLINSVNDTPVVTGEQLRQAVQPLPAAAEVRLQLSRGREVREVKVRLDAPVAEAAGPAVERVDRIASP
jgi:S1-C subfamily serine protease